MSVDENEEFLTDLPPIPEGEFVIFGIVSSCSPSPLTHLSNTQHQAYAYPEHADALEAVYSQTTRNAENEPGTTYYCLARDDKDPTAFHFFERYSDRAAFDTHNEQPIIKSIFAKGLMRGCKAVITKPIYPAASTT